jgi:hypothetical protein
MSSEIGNVVANTSPQRTHPLSATRGKSAIERKDKDEAQIDRKPASRTRQSRRHVQQNLHQLDRLIRHEIKDAINEAGDLDHETIAAMKDLTKDFRTSLKDSFLSAGKGHDFDHSAILSGVSDAIVGLTEGLRELRGAEDPETPTDPTIVVPPPLIPEKDILPEESVPGGLLTVHA